MGIAVGDNDRIPRQLSCITVQEEKGAFSFRGQDASGYQSNFLEN